MIREMGQGQGSAGGGGGAGHSRAWQLYVIVKDNCGHGQAWRLYEAIREGDCRYVEESATKSPKLVNKALFHKRLTPLHVAAFYGQLQVMTCLLEKGANVNCTSCTGQTPLMLACKTGKWNCVEHLLQHGGNVLLFDTSHARTSLHYAAKGGHVECIKRILAAAQSGPVAESWGFVRFVNMRDSTGITALHLAARGGYVGALQLLLDSGALVSATTSTTGNGPGHGSTPLHYAARGGSTGSVQELLAWGADRNQRDLTGYTAYGIAKKHNNTQCAALLNPNVAEPLVWPSPCKFMNALDPETKKLLEEALHQANQLRGLRLTWLGKGTTSSASSFIMDDSIELNDNTETCCICFEHSCAIQVQDCGHQMCATCILTLCCHNKPNPAIPFALPPACPFCRRSIGFITLIQSKETAKPEPMDSCSTRSSTKAFST